MQMPSICPKLTKQAIKCSKANPSKKFLPDSTKRSHIRQENQLMNPQSIWLAMKSLSMVQIFLCTEERQFQLHSTIWIRREFKSFRIRKRSRRRLRLGKLNWALLKVKIQHLVSIFARNLKENTVLLLQIWHQKKLNGRKLSLYLTSPVDLSLLLWVFCHNQCLKNLTTLDCSKICGRYSMEKKLVVYR